jgi:hypothetical protein
MLKEGSLGREGTDGLNVGPMLMPKINLYSDCDDTSITSSYTVNRSYFYSTVTRHKCLIEQGLFVLNAKYLEERVMSPWNL